MQLMQVPTVQTVKKAVGAPQAQFLEMLSTCPLQRQVLMAQKLRKTADVPQLQFIDEVVDIHVEEIIEIVNVAVRGCGTGSACSRATRCESDQ